MSGFGKAGWGAGVSARRDKAVHFYPGLRCAKPRAKFCNPFRVEDLDLAKL